MLSKRNITQKLNELESQVIIEIDKQNFWRDRGDSCQTLKESLEHAMDLHSIIQPGFIVARWSMEKPTSQRIGE